MFGPTGSRDPPQDSRDALGEVGARSPPSATRLWHERCRRRSVVVESVRIRAVKRRLCAPRTAARRLRGTPRSRTPSQTRRARRTGQPQSDESSPDDTGRKRQNPASSCPVRRRHVPRTTARPSAFLNLASPLFFCRTPLPHLPLERPRASVWPEPSLSNKDYYSINKRLKE